MELSQSLFRIAPEAFQAVDIDFTGTKALPVIDSQIQVIDLDSFVQEKQVERVDFIKFDVEGTEQLVLLGARETILQFKPKLAISLIHSSSLWTGMTTERSNLFPK